MKLLGSVEIDHEEEEFGVVTSHGEAMWCCDEIEARVIHGLQGGRLLKRRVFFGAIEQIAGDPVQAELDRIIGDDGSTNV